MARKPLPLSRKAKILTPFGLKVMEAVAEGSKSGSKNNYAAAYGERIIEIYGGFIDSAHIYVTLRRLLNQKLVISKEGSRSNKGGYLIKVYKITEKGVEAIKASREFYSKL